MRQDNEDLYDEALDAINELFTDTSVSQDDTLANLSSLVDEIKFLKNSIEVDIKKESTYK